jgi:hypothetical protein
MSVRTSSAWCLLPLVLVSGCGSTPNVGAIPGDGGPDATDATTDVTMDAPAESSPEATVDSGTEAAGEGGIEAGREAGTEAGAEAGPEAGPGPTCDAGQCVVELAVDTGDPYAIAVSATDVYWTENPGQNVMTVPIVGGAATTFATGQNVATSLAVDANFVYWVSSGNGTVVKEPLGGGALTTMVTGQPGAFAVAVDATSVYWSTTNAIMKMPLAGGAMVTLAFGTNNVNDAVRLVLDSTSIYWDNYADTTVMKVGLDGSGLSTLASPQNPWWLAPSGGDLYFQSGYDILHVPAAGGTVSTFTTGTGCEWGMAADAVNIYWFTCSDVMQEPVAGGTPVTIAPLTGTAGFNAMAVDSTSLYWTQGYSPGSVWRATPK